MNKRTAVAITSLIICLANILFCLDSIADEPRTDRIFKFRYGATVVDAPEGSKVKVWIPIAQSNEQQNVRIASVTTPAPMQTNFDKQYGNKIGHFETTAQETGMFAFNVNYHVARSEAKTNRPGRPLSKSEKDAFLRSNRLVPIDGKPIELLKDESLSTDPYSVGAQLYDIVESHMKYDKSKPGYGNGDSVWACDSRTGNCTDFHSLFISLARSQSLPARFEIGFPLPTDKAVGKIGGYHCWAWFYAEDKGWFPVDISEADKHPEMKDYYFGRLTADRMSLTTGRDIELVPESQDGPLNYFVYPYVEVDGKPWPKEKIKLDFFFSDVAPGK